MCNPYLPKVWLTIQAKIATICMANDCDFISYSKRDLNPHNHYWSRDFKSLVSTIPPFEQPQLVLSGCKSKNLS